MQKYNSRAEVPDKYKWDLSEFFENDEQFNEAFNETKDLIKKKGHIFINPEKMYVMNEILIKII